MRPLVIVESPYAGYTELHLRYARAACLDCVRRGENPFASHLFYTQFLDDSTPEDRKLGIELGYDLWQNAETVAFYVDFGMSPGMIIARDIAWESTTLKIEVRRLPSFNVK